jgi:aminoglycoside phosphotransferase (APT) family kinase protein
VTDGVYIPDASAVAEYLDSARPGLRVGALEISLIAGGRSNLTYLVHDDANTWVLRRPPLGHVLQTAHDMSREFRIIGALGPTAVPVPGTVLFCPDETVLGAPWYLMERALGTTFSSATRLVGRGEDFAQQAGSNLVDTLVALHSIDIGSVGLADFGHPEGYLQRQLLRWHQQLDDSRSRELAGIDDLYSELSQQIPASPASTILHGDYRLGNVMLADDATITAVLDWEMSTLGDPLADVGLLVMYTTVDNLVDGGADLAATGFPSATELVARYATGSGRDVSNLPWYVAFSYFKLAVIIEGIHYRFTQGHTVGDGFERMGAYVEPLVAAGTAALRGH